jgi:hypothetical protein
VSGGVSSAARRGPLAAKRRKKASLIVIAETVSQLLGKTKLGISLQGRLADGFLLLVPKLSLGT